MQLIKTDDYLLFVDKEAKLEKGDYHLEKGLIINKFPDYLTDLDECDKILAYYPLKPQAKPLELPLLPNPFKHYRVGRKQKRAILDEKGIEVGIFKTGFEVEAQKYCDYLNNQQFSLDDLKFHLRNFGLDLFGQIRRGEVDVTEDIRDSAFLYSSSIVTQQLPKEFLPTYELVGQCGCECHVPRNWVMHMVPCCYPKQIMKIIKNSENKDDLVGTYKY